MKKSNTYTINHDNATITITKAYSKNANKPGTKEFKELTTLHKSYPDYKIVQRTAVVDKTTKQTHSGLSYGNMKKYIQKKNENKPDMSEAFLQMAGVFSQLELSMIRARVKSGMANAKAKGAKIGRPRVSAEEIPALFYRHYPAYKNGSLNVSELARVCGLSRTTVYKYIGLLE